MPEFEFQSNASRFYHLPPRLAVNHDSRSFCFIVDDEPTMQFEVTVASSYSVQELKGAITEQLGLKMATPIILWKLNTPIRPTLDTSVERKDFTDQVKNMQLDPDSDDLPGIVQLRYATRKVGSYWEKNPPPECLHLIVRVLSLPPIKRRSILSEDEGREHKRTRVTIEQPLDGVLENLHELHRLFWGVPDSPLFVTNRVAIPDPKSLRGGEVKEFKIINIPHPIRFPDGSSTLVITKIFNTFRELLLRDDDAWEKVQGRNMPFANPSHCSVISGQPGIGKTVFLNNVLVHRLQAKMVTIYCNVGTHAYVFSDDGVRRVSLDNGVRIPELDYNPRSCALVNLGARLQRPPDQFYPSGRLGRLVVATSPNPGHVVCFRERPALTYYMPTWDWDDLYCGSLVHVGKVSLGTRPIIVKLSHKELLREAYWKFSGIPRICYKIFKDTSMVEHLQRVDIALANINYQSIDDFARAIEGSLACKSETSHNLIKTEPIPKTDWKWSHSELQSPFISGLVFEQVRHHRTIRLSEAISRLLHNPDTRSHAGKLFEPAAHRTLEKGMKINPTALTSGAPPLILDIHKANTDVVRRFYTLSVRAAPRSQKAHPKYFNQYLLPMSMTQESLDAVVITEHFTAFLQMTVSARHGIKLHGILDLLEDLPTNAKKNLRIVFVLPSDDEETRSFKRQSITYAQDASEKDIALVAAIPQYIYRLPLSSFYIRSS